MNGFELDPLLCDLYGVPATCFVCSLNFFSQRPRAMETLTMVSSVYCLRSPSCCITSESHRPLVSCWKHQFLFHLVLCWLIIDRCLLLFVVVLLRLLVLFRLTTLWLRFEMVWPYESLLSYGSCCFPSPIPSRALFSLFCLLDISLFPFRFPIYFDSFLFPLAAFYSCLRCFGILLHVCCWWYAGFMRSYRTFSSHECDAACLLTDRQCKERSLKK